MSHSPDWERKKRSVSISLSFSSGECAVTKVVVIVVFPFFIGLHVAYFIFPTFSFCIFFIFMLMQITQSAQSESIVNSLSTASELPQQANMLITSLS